MSKANIEVRVDLGELAYELAETVHEHDLLAFILEIDANFTELRFTKKLHRELGNVIDDYEAE